MKLLLFDLDDTLLRSDKTISAHTLSVLNRCREKGCLIGISTSRSFQNAQAFVGMLSPELIISSGGALVQYQNQKIVVGSMCVYSSGLFCHVEISVATAAIKIQN